MSAPSISRLIRAFFHLSESESIPHSDAHDLNLLLQLGYNQEFQRDFTLRSVFCLSFSSVGLLPSLGGTLIFSLGYAGTGPFIWGWAIAAFMTQSLALSIAELCSSFPTAGALHYASYNLAPIRWRKLASWITAWSNLLGQVTAPASVNYVCSKMILAGAKLLHPTYTPHMLHVFLVTCGLLIINAVVGSLRSRLLAIVSQIGAIINMITLLIFYITIPVVGMNSGKFNNSSNVWGTLTNGTDWPDGVDIIMSFFGIIWTMSGYDASVHLSEECRDAENAAPRAIIRTSVLGAILGWFAVLVIAYTITDIQAIINLEVDQPMASYLVQVLGKKTGLVIYLFIILCCVFEGQACMIISSRLIYACSRDGILPGFQILGKITRSGTPVYAVWVDCVIGIALNSLVFGGPIVIGAVFSVGVTAQYVAFAIPIALRLIFRDKFRPGRWNLGKYFPYVCGISGILWSIFVIPFLSFPVKRGSNLTPALMNWTCLVYGGIMCLSLIWYVTGARKNVKVKKRNDEEGNKLSEYPDARHRLLVDSDVSGPQAASGFPNSIGSMGDLNNVIAMAKMAVESTPDDHPNLAGHCNNLGILLRLRFERTGSIADLDEAIAKARKAVETTPDNHPDLVECCNNLGIALRLRFERNGSMDDLGEAIAMARKAVELTSDDHPEMAGHCNNLGVGLRLRFDRMGSMDDLDEAISMATKAVERTPDDHPDMARHCNNLGIGLRLRFKRMRRSRQDDCNGEEGGRSDG